MSSSLQNRLCELLCACLLIWLLSVHTWGRICLEICFHCCLVERLWGSNFHPPQTSARVLLSTKKDLCVKDWFRSAHHKNTRTQAKAALFHVSAASKRVWEGNPKKSWYGDSPAVRGWDGDLGSPSPLPLLCVTLGKSFNLWSLNCCIWKTGIIAFLPQVSPVL